LPHQKLCHLSGRIEGSINLYYLLGLISKTN
ncbi:MAG: hypothetical protein ACI917_000276, partial [Patiriisocius sp.]